MASAGRETSDQPSRARGRPRDASVDEVVLGAGAALFRDGGLEAVTVSAIVARTGVARTSIYRRWPSRDALSIAVVQRAMGQELIRRRRTVVETMYAAAEAIRLICSSDAFRDVLPCMIAGLLAPPDTAEHMDVSLMLPGRTVVAEAYRSGAAAESLASKAEPDVVADIIAGAVLQRLLMTGAPPDEATTRAIVDVLLDGLRERPRQAG